MNESKDLPEPFRGGQGHPDEQVRAEGSLLTWVIVLSLGGTLATFLVLGAMKLWAAAMAAVGQAGG
jgi:hypothetical protein